MREIKFRAWHDKSKIMLSVDLVDFSGCYVRRPDPCIIAKNEEGCFLLDEVILEQFTGLHDSTLWEELTKGEQEKFIDEGNDPSDWIGKEIYEGDVFYSNEVDEFQAFDFYKWYRIEFTLGCFDIRGIGFSRPLNQVNHKIKVLGNIHQHSHLWWRINER